MFLVPGKFALLFVAGLALAGCAPLSSFTAGRTTTLQNEQKVRLETFRPTAQEQRGTILLLHGAGGIPGDGTPMRRLSRQLADEGYLVLFPHYLNATGHWFVRKEQIDQHFEDWKETVDGLITHAATTSKTGQIGIFGFSLGGFLAIANATEDPRVAAVAELAGGIPEDKEWKLANAPPMLILHGTDDERVPVKLAHRLAAGLDRHGIPHTTVLYEGQGHVLTPEAEADATTHILKFFDRRLAGD